MMTARQSKIGELRPNDQPAPRRFAREIALRHEPIDQPISRCLGQFERGNDVENVHWRARTRDVFENGEGPCGNTEFVLPLFRKLDRVVRIEIRYFPSLTRRNARGPLVKSKIGTHGSLTSIQSRRQTAPQ